MNTKPGSLALLRKIVLYESPPMAKEMIVCHEVPSTLLPETCVALMTLCPCSPVTRLVEGGREVGDQRGFAGAALRPHAVRVAQHGGLVKGLRCRQLAVVAAQVHVLAAHPDIRLPRKRYTAPGQNQARVHDDGLFCSRAGAVHAEQFPRIPG